MKNKELTPLERSARNNIVWQLVNHGFTVSSVTNIMNMNVSTVSRIADKKPATKNEVELFNKS